MLTQLIEAGFQLEIVETDRLKVQPAEKLKDEHRQLIRANKATLLRELRDERRILDWLDAIEEFDAESRSEVIQNCRTNQNALDYYLMRSLEVDMPAKVIPITKSMLLSDCSECLYLVRSEENPSGGLSSCNVRVVPSQLPHIKRRCNQFKRSVIPH